MTPTGKYRPPPTYGSLPSHQKGASRGHPTPHGGNPSLREVGQVVVLGRPVWVWLLWAGHVGYAPNRSAHSVHDMVIELDKLIAEKPDEWAAFVAVQRIHGRDIWGTEAK